MAETLSFIKAVSTLNDCLGKINTKKSKITGTPVYLSQMAKEPRLFHIEEENKSQIRGVFLAPQTWHLFPALTTQSTTNSPANHHTKNPLFPKTPLKKPRKTTCPHPRLPPEKKSKNSDIK
jgi:hypothetical protein